MTTANDLNMDNSTEPQAADDGRDDRGRQPAASCIPGLPLIVEIGGEVRPIVPAMLRAEEYMRQLQDNVQAAADPPLFDLRHLLEWCDADRWLALAFIAGLRSGYTIRCDEGSAPTANLFVAVLAAMAGSEDVTRCGRGVQAAVEAAALMHYAPQALPAACNRIHARLQELGVAGYTQRQLQRQAEQIAAGLRADGHRVDQHEAIPVSAVLPAAPVSLDAIVPDGWLLSAEGVGRRAGENTVVAIPAPLVITRRLTDVEGEAEYLGVAWPRDGRWHAEVVPRANVAASRTIVELAAYGAPVTSNTASIAVQYLADYEAYNLEILPRSRVARHLGWQGPGGRDGFLWGTELLGQCEPAPREMTATEPTAAAEIIFRGADEGDTQLADGYHAAGTLQGWRAAMAPIEAFPRVQLAVYAALTSPLLEILGSDNFIVSYAGATSQGKTITLRIAASCWGNPNEKSTTAAIATWDATRVWFGRAPAVLNHLPLVVDDTKRASDRSLIAQMLYDVASGRGRGRGSREGLARNEAFRTVMLTTGEAPIVSFSEEGGTRARVLELWGSPFGRADAATAQIVNRINDGVCEHYGHLGPCFVQYLLANRDCWPEWREQYREFRQAYTDAAGTNPVAARMATHLAAISMAARIVHEAVDLPWQSRDVVDELWTELTVETPEADRAAAALRYVLSWAHGHRQEFWQAKATIGSPSAGWAGRSQLDSGNEDYIGFLPHKLDEVLRNGGFEPEPIRRLWHDRQWLKVTAGKRTYRTRVGRELVYLVAIGRNAIDSVEEPGEVEDDRERPQYPFRRVAAAPGVN